MELKGRRRTRRYRVGAFVRRFVAACILLHLSLSAVVVRWQRERPGGFDGVPSADAEDARGLSKTTGERTLAWKTASLHRDARELLRSDASKADATIIVQLKGEMCNNLQKFAFGFGLGMWLKQSHNATANIVPRHMPRKGKWASARDDIHRCFPNLRRFDFEQGNRPEFKWRRRQQSEWLQGYSPQSPTAAAYMSQTENQKLEMSEVLQRLLQGRTTAEIEAGLALLDELARRKDKPSLAEQLQRNITIPNAWIGNRPMHNVFLDKYLDVYRSLFEFDTQSVDCCGERPHPDESVFHFRQFATELQKLSFEEQAARGYLELSPRQAAQRLFRHLGNGDRLAITTRFHNNVSEAYAAAFRQRGVEVRIIANQTGVQDFCFPMPPRKELVGTAKSTFVRWAGFLGTATIVRLYSVRVPGTNQSAETGGIQTYAWQNEEMRRRFTFEEYDFLATSP